MNAMDLLRIAPFINDCPNCGNPYVGKDQGSLEVDDYIIKRSCKCGYHFVYDVRDGTDKKKIKQAIQEAVKKSGDGHVVE